MITIDNHRYGKISTIEFQIHGQNLKKSTL